MRRSSSLSSPTWPGRNAKSAPSTSPIARIPPMRRQGPLLGCRGGSACGAGGSGSWPCGSAPGSCSDAVDWGQYCTATPKAYLIDRSLNDRIPVYDGSSRRGEAPSDRSQAQVRVVLERLEDRALGLRQRPGRALRRLGQRPSERPDEELVRVLLEHERGRLARGADHAARRAGEADEVLALAAARAAGQLGREPGGEQQLEPEGERV